MILKKINILIANLSQYKHSSNPSPEKRLISFRKMAVKNLNKLSPIKVQSSLMQWTHLQSLIKRQSFRTMPNNQRWMLILSIQARFIKRNFAVTHKMRKISRKAKFWVMVPKKSRIKIKRLIRLLWAKQLKRKPLLNLPKSVICLWDLMIREKKELDSSASCAPKLLRMWLISRSICWPSMKTLRR